MSRFVLSQALVVVAMCVGATAAQSARAAEKGDVDLAISIPATSRSTTAPNKVSITVKPGRDYPGSSLKIVTAGVLSLQDAGGFEQEPQELYFPSLKINQQLKRDFGPLRRGQEKTANLAMLIRGSGYGYITALVEGNDGHDNNKRSVDSFTYYAVSDGQQVFVSKLGFLDAEVQQVRAGSGSPEAIEKRIRVINRGGAQSALQSEPILFSPTPLEDNATISGRVTFTDRNGGQHPVRRSQVEAYEEKGGGEALVGSSTTDNDGRYKMVIPLQTGVSRDIFVLAKAEGQTVRVINGNQGTWAIASATSRVARLGATIKVDLTATNLLENNTAFEVYEAVNYASEYVAALVGANPRRVSVNFPNPGSPDGSSYNGASHTIKLAATDSHDWDNIHHEYGHHLQKLFDLANSGGGRHSSSQNLCKVDDRGKDKGIRLAWGEAWPTFFGVSLQNELSLKRLGIPTVGDTRYTDTGPAGKKLDYDLEDRNSKREVGEGNEAAIMRVLWDLYDKRRDGDDGIAITASDLWKSVREARPRHFSGWWQSFVSGKGIKAVGQYGAILASHGLASAPIAPERGAVLSSDTAFKWQAVNHCADGGQGQYSLRIYDEGLTTALYSSPFATSTSLTVNMSELRGIAANNRKLFWAVVARDQTVPATGEFHGPLIEFSLAPD